MSVAEVAEYLGVSESKVRQWIRRSVVPYVKLDGQYKFFLPVVREWLRANVVPQKNGFDGENAAAHDSAKQMWESITER